MRIVFCNKCTRMVRGHGTSRVLRKLVFHFCTRCWRERENCEAFMRRIAGVPESILKEVAESRARAASVRAGALPESLERFLVAMGEEGEAI